MLRKRRLSLFVLAAVILSLILSPKFLFAGFKLIDAIEEFGEKRFLKPRPARISLGPVKFYPTLRTEVTYDDNVFLSDQDEQNGVIFNITPSAILEVPINTHQIAIGYEADFEIFGKSRHSNQTDQNQNFFALADIKFPNFYINVLQRFRETSGRSGTTFTSRIPRFEESVHPKIGVRWKRFIFEMGYRYYMRDYRRQVDDSRDFELMEWTSVLFYDLFANLKALVEGQVSQIDYDDNYPRTGTFTQLRAGLEGEVIRNLKVKLRSGVQFRNYETESKPDFNSWIASLDMEYLWRDDVKIEFSAERVPIEATFGTVNYYKRHIMRLGLEYEFIQKWTWFNQFKIYRDDYTERATRDARFGFRRDAQYMYNTGLRYEMLEWLEWELAYRLARRNSNFSNFDYTDHRVTVTSTMSY